MYLKTKHVDRERKEEIFRPQILFCKHVFNKSCDRTKTKRYIHVRSLFALIDDNTLLIGGRHWHIYLML